MSSEINAADEQNDEQNTTIENAARGRHSERVIVNADELELDPYQPRRQSNEPADPEFVASIEENGLLNDLLVRPVECSEHDFEDGISYLILGGSRRFRALKEAGLTDVPCKVIEADDLEAQRLAFIDNMQRKDLSDYEVMSAVSKMYDALSERLIPESGKVPCPIDGCEKEYSGRLGVRRHLSSHDELSDEEIQEQCSGVFLSETAVYEDIAKSIYGSADKAKTVEHIVRVSKLPSISKALVKTEAERSEEETGALRDYNVADDTPGYVETPTGMGEGVPRVLVDLASLASTSTIDESNLLAPFLLRAYASHKSEDTNNTLASIKKALKAWQEELDDRDAFVGEDAFEKALSGELPEPEEPEVDVEEPATAPEAAEAPETPEDGETDEEDESPSPETDEAHEPAQSPTEDVGADDDVDDGAKDIEVLEPEPEPEGEDEPSDEEFTMAAGDLLDEIANEEPATPSVELKENHRRFVQALPATGDELASELDISKSTVRDWVSAIRKAHGEDLIESPSRESVYRWTGPTIEDGSLRGSDINPSAAEQSIIEAMPGTPSELAERTEYAVATVKARVSELRAENGEDIVTIESDDEYRWNGPEQTDLTIEMSGSDILSVEPADAVTPEFIRQLIRYSEQ